MSAPSRLVPVSLLGGTLACLFWEARSVAPQNDDAYISYRYARNLIEGHGLVYNVGEYVEGFTNLLWTLLAAIGLALGSPAEVVGHGLGLMSGVGALAATAWLARVGLPDERAWLWGLAPWMLWGSLSFAVWTTSGMETPLFIALVTAALAAQAHGRIGWATVLACLATLTRPDGALVAGVVFAAHFLQHGLRGRRAWAPPASYAAFLGGLTLFRLFYYGVPLPNTFYAKVGGIPISHGVDYAVSFLVSDVSLLLVPALLCPLRDRRLWPALLYCVGTFGYVISIGGDAFPHSRFLLPILPCLVLLSIRGVDAAFGMNRRLGWVMLAGVVAQLAWNLLRADAAPLFAATALAALVIGSLGWRRLGARPLAALVALASIAAFHAFVDFRPVFHGIRAPEPMAGRFDAVDKIHGFHRETYRVSVGRARRLRRQKPPPRLVAAVGIGALGYYSRLPILDMVGLIDPVVARSRKPTSGMWVLPGHQRSDPEYILARQPDVIMIGRKGSFAVPAEMALRAHPGLKASYRWDEKIPGYRRKGSRRR